MMNESDLILAIQDAMQLVPEDDGGLRFSELEDATGLSRNPLRRELHRLIKDGKATAYRARRLNVVGEMFSCVVYKLL